MGLSEARKGASGDWSALRQGAKFVVDSAPIIYLLEDNARFAPRFLPLFEAEAARQVAIAISTITLAEVLAGPYAKGQDALAQRYARTLGAFEVVPVSAEIATSAARLRARYRLKLPDAIQLATALEIGADALVTHDRDFSGVEGLLILDGS